MNDVTYNANWLNTELNKLPFPAKSDIQKDIDEKYANKVVKVCDIPSLEEEKNEQINSLYNTLKADYYREYNRLYGLYKVRLYEIYGCDNKEVNDIAYSVAYDRGHSSGYHEVEGIFQDMVIYFEKAYNIGKEQNESVKLNGDLDGIVCRVAEEFRTYGGWDITPDDTFSVALADTKLQFASGVSVTKVVYFVANELIL